MYPDLLIKEKMAFEGCQKDTGLYSSFIYTTVEISITIKHVQNQQNLGFN